MTTTPGPPARSGAPEPPEATDPEDHPADGPAPGAEDAAGLCDQAQDLAENGHLERAAALYERAAAADPRPRLQARSLLGLAVVQDQRGDLAAAREAARRAVSTGDDRFAPRAAHHLALSLEQEGEHAEAERTWRRLLEIGGPAHTAVAHYGLAREAEGRGEHSGAEEHWEAALALPAASEPISRLQAETVVEAARDLGGRLLERGLPGAAAAAVERGLALADDPALRLLRAATHLEHAIADTGAIVDAAGTADPDEPRPGAGTSGAAVELLAGLLALRGDPEASARAWRAGLDIRDTGTADHVRHRLRRGFAVPQEEQEEGAGTPWWEPYLEEAVATDSAPALAGELFAVLTRMHNTVGVPLAEGEVRPAALREAMEEALRTPSDLVWGQDVHADFRRRLTEAMGGRDVLPEGWPDRA
ncbi:tetratricopeptide repeat protein [Nocardiopsis kunsanensis]|uniref:Tetratricopeptide repeat protein n=1 Tax=Nocardiopsis kunsanensis TaxID=141693 RepID=A0A919CGP9_9ACTN|nr:tetratricopeptide repeat protein [Nocardiopsis kunsanensis]GHD20415.1 hypothetical protein GCM10007147_12650 [Nocardiopsis kunsanensis]